MGDLHAAAERVRDRLESSPIIGWLKHLDGRYAYINPAYVQQLAAPADRLLGRTDSELEPREAVDGPRLRDRGSSGDEPLMLEYRITAFEGRPALSAMRFPVRDSAGEIVAVCGVAAPSADAPLMRSECADLMELEGGGQPTSDGESEQQQRRIAELHEASASAARRAHELTSELATERAANEQLRRELDGARARLTELEHAHASELARLSELAPGQPTPEQPTPEPAAPEQAVPEQAAPAVLAVAPEPITPRSDEAPSWSASAQRALTAALAEASEWRIGLRDIVKVLGPQAGWDAVCAWGPDQRGRTLRCAAMWTADAGDRDEFETRTWQRPYPFGAGSLGRAFAAPDASLFTALPASDDERLLAASREGMRSVLLVPVKSGRSPVALLELMSRRELTPSGELVAAMDAIALQLGHFWHLLREGAQPHWRLGRL